MEKLGVITIEAFDTLRGDVGKALDAMRTEVGHSIKRAEVKGILKLCRARGELIGYLPIAKALGFFSGGKELATILGQIQEECQRDDQPLLSSLVVKTDTGLPGTGYFECARSLGYHIDHNSESEYNFWADQARLLGISEEVIKANALEEVA